MNNTKEVSNKNFLSPLNFKFQLKRAPSVNYFIQKVSLADIRAGGIPEVPNPYTKYPVTPDHLIYGSLNITFKIDEDLQNFMEIYDWLTAIGYSESNEGFKKLEENAPYSGDSTYSDISLLVLNSAKEPTHNIQYIDCIPTSLTAVAFNTTDTTVNYVSADASFRYTSYKIDRYR